MNKTGLQQWVDMYNKADKERFEALLQRDKYKKALDEIEKIINNFAVENIITLPDVSTEQNYELIAKQYGEPIVQIMQKIKEVKHE